jgi:hypothetical protein
MSPVLERGHKAFLVTMLTIEGLIDKGLISGPKTLTPEGRAEAIRLRDEEGFLPTREETRSVMAFLLSGGPSEEPM